MPFKKNDDEYYFEKVEVLSRDYLKKENDSQFLALCPLCAAKYKEFIKKDNNAMNQLYSNILATKNDNFEFTLQLGSELTTIRFVELHLLDLKEILLLGKKLFRIFL